MNSQINLIKEFLSKDQPLNKKNRDLYNLYLNNDGVSEIYLVKLNLKALKLSEIEINIQGESHTANLTRIKTRLGKNFSWFGKMDDGFGIFFTVINNKVASKFYLGDYAYTLLPLEGDIHALIEYSSINIGKCGTELHNVIHEKPPIKDIDHRPVPNNGYNRSLLHDDDDACNLRVIIAFTADAEGDIMGTIDLFAQMMVDEANLAYLDSQINFEMELARTMRTSYDEVETNTGINSTDLVLFQNATPPLDEVHDMREVYQSDIQILVRRDDWMLPDQLFGEAFQEPTYSRPPREDEAFCVVAVDGVTDGRFSFTHEVGHLQGARHDITSIAPPIFARGFQKQ